MRQGFALFAGAAPEIITACAREAEAIGYSSFWVNHPGSTDGLAALALGGRATTGIDLGIGVIPLHTRGPESIAQGVKAQGLPTQRLLLGVGSPNPQSLARVRDGITALRASLPGTRLVVAALGPKMCHLAGEIADGVLFNWLTPEWAKKSAAWVREGAAVAKRQPPPLYAYIRVALGAAAAGTLAEEGRRYTGIPAYAAHFERMGVKPVDTAVAVMTPDGFRAALAKWEGAVDEIVLRAITGADTVDENLALLRAARPERSTRGQG